MHHFCDSNATCTNTLGTYTCECDAGYIGNGFICQGIFHCSVCIYNNSYNRDAEIQPPIVNSQQEIIANSQQEIIISSTVGVMVFLLLITIVVVMVYICYYVRKCSGVSKEKNDLYVII